jgi:hypothetical protein
MQRIAVRGQTPMRAGCTEKGVQQRLPLFIGHGNFLREVLCRRYLIILATVFII